MKNLLQRIRVTMRCIGGVRPGKAWKKAVAMVGSHQSVGHSLNVVLLAHRQHPQRRYRYGRHKQGLLTQSQQPVDIPAKPKMAEAMPFQPDKLPFGVATIGGDCPTCGRVCTTDRRDGNCQSCATSLCE